ncbi:PaaI family thioesterase [Kaustia mangrovi]|uniref:PaaI family thioesterase n=1 Tax=Kaustia mangrovi TaxID=2593653 RepID=A0A7S8HE40_9HYPH|nr:PaaI family thioesterase [Kaustia mangrovi]QPC44983.1 PaaI family thioesterase [Kaustia mangrovi]
MSDRKTGLKWGADEILAFLERDFPQVFRNGQSYAIERLEPKGVSVRLIAGEAQLRPGGTVSGPTMMELVDLAMYMMLLARHGDAARLCVTTNFSISFLRKPPPGDIVVDLELIKHGRALSVGDARVHAAGREMLVAHGECTYHMVSDSATQSR